MVKRSFSILFLLAFTLQVLYLPTLVFYLDWNQDRIADELCVNKLKPELMCSGRCYISEVTAEALGNDADQGALPTHEEHIPASLIANTANALQPLPDPGLCTEVETYDFNHYSYQTISGIFHPPRFTSPFFFA